MKKAPPGAGLTGVVAILTAAMSLAAVLSSIDVADALALVAEVEVGKAAALTILLGLRIS